MTITGTDSGWYKISFNGKTGYIASSLVDKSGSTAPASTNTGKVTYDANVRSGPGTSYSIIGDVKAGDTVTITGTDSGWYKISFNGGTGYIASSLVNTGSAAPTPAPTPAPSTSTNKTGRVNYDANIRSGPGTENPIVGDVKAGATVTITGSEKGWYKVSYNGVTGYIASSLVDETGTAAADPNATGRANSDANIRSGPGTNYSVVGDIAAGQTFEILKTESNGWYKINYNGTTGYIAGGLVDKA